MKIATTLDVAGFAKRNATISFAPSGAKLNVDFGCAPPVAINSFLRTPSQPWKSIDDLLLGVFVDSSAGYECAGKVFQFVGGVFKSAAAKLAGGAKVTAIAVANATAYTLSKVSGGAKKMTSEIGKAFGAKGGPKRPPKRTKDNCGNSPDHMWSRDFKQCWRIGYRYLYLVRNKQGQGLCMQVNNADNRKRNAVEFGNCDMNWTQQWSMNNG